MPFGEELYVNVGGRSTNLNYGTNEDDIRQKFTGYQKDKETGLDFAEARMYANNFGRFTAVDPLLASGRSADPQSFNRYIYTSNNPIIRTDPTGLDWYTRYNEETKLWEFNETGGTGWEPVKFGNNEWITVQNWCRRGECGDGNQVGYLYRSGGQDLGRRANGIILNILSDAGIAAADTGIGTAQFGYNAFVAVPNVFYGGLARLNLQYFTTGRPLEGLPSYEYWAPANQTQANANLAWSAVSLYYGAAASAGARSSTLSVVPESVPFRFAPIKAGSSGGPTAGNRYISVDVRRQAAAENPYNFCVYCRQQSSNLQFEHAIPRSMGGNSTIGNIQRACPFCNQSKGARDFPVNPPPGYEGPFPYPWRNQ